MQRRALLALNSTDIKEFVGGGQSENGAEFAGLLLGLLIQGSPKNGALRQTSASAFSTCSSAQNVASVLNGFVQLQCQTCGVELSI